MNVLILILGENENIESLKYLINNFMIHCE